MIKIVYTFVALGFLLLNSANSYYNADVPADFSDMLANPTLFRPSLSTSLVTKVTTPFVQDVTPTRSRHRDPKPTPPSLALFANPTAAVWQAQNNGSKISPHQILDVMGQSRRGLLSDQRHARYQRITNAQTIGLLGMIQGKSFGLRQTAASATDQEAMARELLNIGNQMPDAELASTLAEFQRIYTSGGLTPSQQSHIQTSAMLVLKGSNSRIEDGAWYLKGRDKGRVLRRIEAYAAKFLPVDVVVDNRAGIEATPDSVIPIFYKGNYSLIYGTPGIQASGINASATDALYPKLLILGNSQEPTTSPGNLFSINLQVRPNEYLMIMQPETDMDIALLPAYMETPSNTTIDLRNKVKEEIAGDIMVNISSSKGAHIRLADNNIHWSTLADRNTGNLIFDGIPPETYSFLATVTGARDRKPKHFYYWRPTTAQMLLLKSHLQFNKTSIASLMNFIKTDLTGSNKVPDEILREIEAFQSGSLTGF